MDAVPRRQDGSSSDDDEITDREFALLTRLLRDLSGISLSNHKRYLLVSRLRRRLRELGLESFSAYHRLLTERDSTNDVESERVRFVNAMTTNKTDFFRERRHFRYLAETVVPGLVALAAQGGDKRIRIWSASCSSGEEPYSIAMTVLGALGARAAGWDVKILASDIDTEVLDRASQAVYPRERTEWVPNALLCRWFLRGTGRNEGLVRVRDELRRLVVVRHINLVDERWPIRATFDAIFCRNVLIYFDRTTQAQVLDRLVRTTKEGGLIFVGHSESIFGSVCGIEPIGDSIYRRIGTPASS